MRRVVVTGMGGITPLGTDWAEIRAAFLAGRTGIKRMAEWDRYHGINTRLAAPAPALDLEERYPRKKLRTMGPVARMAVRATELALTDAGLEGDPVIRAGRTGVAYGSSYGSPGPVAAFAELMTEGSSRNLTATSYIQMMSHTAAVNIGMFFQTTGRIIPTSSACTSSSQAIGYAFEAIRYGHQDVMIAGGADELDATQAAVFDTLYATSVRNDAPEANPRPYDKDRDGLVIGEGAASLILEERERAIARGARIHAELVGFGTNTDGNHPTQPHVPTMATALRLALGDAGLQPESIGFVSGHGTATDWGDVAEAEATRQVLGPRAPIHSLKGHFGHTLGACGAIEAWLAIAMMNEGCFIPTANLNEVDPRCGELDFLMGSPRRLEIDYLMSNNFAFGGINTSLIFRRV